MLFHSVVGCERNKSVRRRVDVVRKGANCAARAQTVTGSLVRKLCARPLVSKLCANCCALCHSCANCASGRSVRPLVRKSRTQTLRAAVCAKTVRMAAHAQAVRAAARDQQLMRKLCARSLVYSSCANCANRHPFANCARAAAHAQICARGPLVSKL